MKWRAVAIVSMLLVSALFVSAGSSIAAPFSGTITLTDGYNEQNYFDTGDDIYFYVTVLDDGAPLQTQWVDVVIHGIGIGEVFNYSYQTDNFGQFNGDDWDDGWYTHSIGDYIMWVNYTGQEVVNTTFEIYTPVAWSATGWTAYYGEDTDTFTENQRVDVYVQAFDQNGNPYDCSYSGQVRYDIEFEGYNVDTEYLDTNNTGHDIGYYYPSGINQFGTYMVTIYNNAVPARVLGYVNFTIVLPNRAVVWPQNYGDNRTVFTEGEHVGYEVHLYYMTNTPYDSNSYAARILLFHASDMQNPLRNNSLNTDSDGMASDWNMYNIGYGDDAKGTYYIRVYNHDWEMIGSGMFMVIDLDIELLPYKSVYSQGDDVQLSVSTSLEDPYTVKITDSSHDQISGASWNVPANTQEWIRSFTFPEIDDGTYYVDVYSNDLLLGYMTFQLKKFSIDARLSQDYFLPGQAGTLYWMAVNNHDGGPITVTGDTEMTYLDTDWDYQYDALDDITGSSGSFGFTIPRDAAMGNSGWIDIDAEDKNDHTDDTTVGFQVGSLAVDVDVDRAFYRPGDKVYMTFTSYVSGSDSIVPNVEIKARAVNDGTRIGDTWTVTTDGAGKASYAFPIPSDGDDGLYLIVMNATFDDNRNIKYNGTGDFTVTSDAVVSLLLYQEAATFSPGDSVSIPYRVLHNGVETSDAQVSFEARLGSWDWNSAETIALGFGSNGQITFRLPADIEGRLFIHATAITADGTAFDSLENIQVTKSTLVLFTNKSVYLPGENVSWFYVLNGDTASSVTYRITDPDGVLLAEGVPVNGTFKFKLPDTYVRAPTATIYVVGTLGTYITQATANVYQGYMMEWHVLSNSYAPGDIMEINYTIYKIGEVPEATGGFQITISIMGEYTQTLWVTEHWGVIKYQLPEDIRDGKHIVQADLAGAPTNFDDVQTVIIDSDAGELAHGTIAGLNSGAFIALLLAIIGIVAGIIGIIIGRKATPKTAPVQEATPEPPAEPIIEEPVEEEFTPAPGYEGTQPSEPQQGDYPPPPPPEQ